MEKNSQSITPPPPTTTIEELKDEIAQRKDTVNQIISYLNLNKS